MGHDPGSAPAWWGGNTTPSYGSGPIETRGNDPGWQGAASGPAAGVGSPGSESPESGVSNARAAHGVGDSRTTLEAGLPGLPGTDPYGGLSRLAQFATLLSTGTTLALAFLLFGRKRRDEAPTASDEDLAAAAASPYAAFGAGLAPAFTGVDPGTGGTDVDLPRWRRPSLLAARRSDPIRNGAEHVNLTFDQSGAATPGGDRQVVRYRLVRLLDRPDELLGQAVDSVDEGDEVVILEHRGTYRRVLTPDGREGWLHRMTLGDIVTDDPEVAPKWGSLDDDVLSAYLSARDRA